MVKRSSILHAYVAFSVKSTRIFNESANLNLLYTAVEDFLHPCKVERHFCRLYKFIKQTRLDLYTTFQQECFGYQYTAQKTYASDFEAIFLDSLPEIY